MIRLSSINSNPDTAAAARSMNSVTASYWAARAGTTHRPCRESSAAVRAVSLPFDTEGLPARGQNPKLGTGPKQFPGERGDCIHQTLAVVENVPNSADRSPSTASMQPNSSTRSVSPRALWGWSAIRRRHGNRRNHPDRLSEIQARQERPGSLAMNIEEPAWALSIAVTGATVLQPSASGESDLNFMKSDLDGPPDAVLSRSRDFAARSARARSRTPGELPAKQSLSSR